MTNNVSENARSYLAKRGIEPWHVFLFVVMFVGWIVSYAVFRQQTISYEDRTTKKIMVLDAEITQLRHSVDRAGEGGVIDTRLSHIEHQIERLVHQSDKIIDRLTRP